MPNKDITKVERAHQFLPFDALTGLREACEKESEERTEKIEFSSDKIDDLNEKIKKISQGDMVDVIYYRDGCYLKITGLFSKIDPIEKYIIIVKDKIPLDDIYDIQIVENY